MVITETWLTENDNTIINEFVPSGYSFSHVPRPYNKRGGGVGVVYKSCLTLTVNDTSVYGNYTHFEYMSCGIKSETQLIQLNIIYRPPPSAQNGFRNSVFFDEWEFFLEKLSTVPHEQIITGDLNFHLDVSENVDTKRFIALLETYGFIQHVKGATHKLGHTLDILITRMASTILTSPPTIADPNLCTQQGQFCGDHLGISFSLKVSKSKNHTIVNLFRRYRAINIPTFIHDLTLALDIIDLAGTACELVTQYNTMVAKLMEKHAPIIEKRITLRPNSPWFNEDLHVAKHNRRKAERIWRLSKCPQDKKRFKLQCQTFNKLLAKTKMEYYNKQITEAGHDQRYLFRITKSLMGTDMEQQLPSCISERQLANDFGDYFMNKIKLIRDKITESSDNSDDVTPLDADVKFQGTFFENFRPPTMDEIKKIIQKSANKSCDLDPMPAWLLKECLVPLLPLITCMMTKSLSEAIVPPEFKKALVRPQLKQQRLDKEGLKNYRPVSNLPFLSKVLEKLVEKRLEEHLLQNNLSDRFQSAYRTAHSTETALVSVHSYIAEQLDQRSSVALIMLDLSAAFDTIDHNILIKRFNYSFGIGSDALHWIKSYLHERYQCIKIGNVISNYKLLKNGVPQGSVLGPQKYCMYSRPLGNIIQHHNFNYHCYADDTQLYIVIDKTHSWLQIKPSLELCLSAINAWMKNNLLKLNQEKTEFIVFTPKSRGGGGNNFDLQFGDTSITTTDKVKNLGVTLDKNLSMEQHISKVIQSSYIQLRNLWHIRKYLNESACKTLVQATIISRLDYCNSLLFGIPKKLLLRLQRLQNSAARLILKVRRHDHITPSLKKLHWLPINRRLEYKVLLLTHKTINNKGPSYLKDQLEEHMPRRHLRSGTMSLLSIPASNNTKYSKQSFKHCAPKLWNSLPMDLRTEENLRTFKNKLKTHLFELAYS